MKTSTIKPGWVKCDPEDQREGETFASLECSLLMAMNARYSRRLGYTIPESKLTYLLYCLREGIKGCPLTNTFRKGEHTYTYNEIKKLHHQQPT